MSSNIYIKKVFGKSNKISWATRHAAAVQASGSSAAV
jgi:hypothetical protein